MHSSVKMPFRFILHQYKFRISDYLGPIDAHLGSRLYGNTAGLNRNITADLAEMKCRVLSEGSFKTEEQVERANQLWKDGYVKLGKFFDDDVISRVKRRYEELINDEAYTKVMHDQDPGNGEVYRKGIVNPVESIPEIKDLLTDEIRDIFRTYYRAPFQVKIVNAYRTRYIPPKLQRKKEIFSENWHIDGKSLDHMKLFVCLNDTTEEDGPLHVLPKSDVKKIAKKRPNFNRLLDGEPGGIVDEIGDPITLTGEVGTAMMANSQACLHRAGIPDPGRKRDIIQFYCAPSTEPWPDDWDQDDLGNTHSGGLFRLVKY